MKCVCCGHKIKPKEGRAYFMVGNRKRYGCWTCNANGNFEKWIDQQPEQATGNDEWDGKTLKESE